jgi:hypothetical protein
MKIITLLIVISIVGGSALYAGDLQLPALDTEHTTQVAGQLDLFQHDKIPFESFATNKESAVQLLEYYAAHTNSITVKMKLPISRAFASLGQYEEAITLAESYVNVYSNDWRGWRVVGGSKYMLKLYKEGFDDMLKAVQLGDEENRGALGAMALEMDRLDVFEHLVLPHLLLSINTIEKYPSSERVQIQSMLVFYAVKANKVDVFTKALRDLQASELTGHEDLKKLISVGCSKFKGPEVDKLCEKFSLGQSEAASGVSESK